MLENLRNRLRGVATEKQSLRDDGSDLRLKRDARGRLTDETGRAAGGNPEKERSAKHENA